MLLVFFVLLLRRKKTEFFFPSSCQWRHGYTESFLWELHSRSTCLHLGIRKTVKSWKDRFPRIYCTPDAEVKQLRRFSVRHGAGFSHIISIFWSSCSFFSFQISDPSHLAGNIMSVEPNAGTLEEDLHHRSEGNLIYSISDRPPWYLCLLLGFQVNQSYHNSTVGVSWVRRMS